MRSGKMTHAWDFVQSMFTGQSKTITGRSDAEVQRRIHNRRFASLAGGLALTGVGIFMNSFANLTEGGTATKEAALNVMESAGAGAAVAGFAASLAVGASMVVSHIRSRREEKQ
ncbi:hypothetical protein FWG95_03230 [Candidatus Saccharibacteria bacterium]|nr:hypothetical protein [Candidatus Saccharibacteria bacterium]